jgi:hypothetical protein
MALIIVIFIIYYITSFNLETSHVFFIIVFGCIVYVIIYTGQQDSKSRITQLDKYMNDLEKTILQQDTQEMMVDAVYSIHKPLKNLRFIKGSKEAQELLYDLRFLQIYEKEDFMDIVVYLEYFFKIHFNIMIGKYDVSTYFQILQDIRVVIINALFSCIHNIPKYSKTFDSPNLDIELRKCINRTQALTYRFLKIVLKKHKAKMPHFTVQGASPYDSRMDSKYHMI